MGPDSEFDDIFSDEPVKIGNRVGGKFKPKPKPKAKAVPIKSKIPPLPSSQPIGIVNSPSSHTEKPSEPRLEPNNVMESATETENTEHVADLIPESNILTHDSDSCIEKTGEENTESFIPTLDTPTVTEPVYDDPISLELSPIQDPLTNGQSFVSEEVSHMHDRTLESKGSEASAINLDTGESLDNQINDQNSIDLSFLGFDHSNPTDSTNDQPQNVTLEKTTESVPKTRKKMATRRAKGSKGKNGNESNLSQNMEAQDNEGSKLSRPRRKCRNVRQLIDEPEDEQLAEEISANWAEGSVINEDKDKDTDYQVENEPQINEENEENETQVKKKRRKSKKAVNDEEKTVKKAVKKRKKADTLTDQGETSNKAPPRAKRQKRRIVDKVLLETPEDEIDFQNVPLRDLIILAEHRERIAKKEGVTSESQVNNNQSTETESRNYNESRDFDYNEEDEFFGNEYGEEEPFNEGHESPKIVETQYINYQTYMDKTPRFKWTKQDTELFYTGLRQFGTDLSMIQQLFPGMTRNQIKLKYKKEERQNQTKLFEALSNPTKDLTQFEQVAERLQKIAAEERRMNGEDEFEGDEEEIEEAEEVLDTTKEEPAKSEEREEVVEDLEVEISVKSPTNDDDFWDSGGLI